MSVDGKWKSQPLSAQENKITEFILISLKGRSQSFDLTCSVNELVSGLLNPEAPVSDS